MTLRRRPRGNRSQSRIGTRALGAVLAVSMVPVTALLITQWAAPTAFATTNPTATPAAFASASSTPSTSPSTSASSQATSSPQGWVKYYIVQPPENGQKEFLYEIAAKTLGDGHLYTEIFNLNKGRLQPGGGRLEDPTAILPGWILILPASASGPGVHFGPLPKVTITLASSPPTPSAAPTPDDQASAPARHNSASSLAFDLGSSAMLALLLLSALFMLWALYVLFMQRRPIGATALGRGGLRRASSLATVIASAGSRLGPRVTGSADAEPATAEQTAARASGTDEPVVLSSTAPRILSARQWSAQLAGSADAPVQELEVAMGDDLIRAALAQVPVASHQGSPRGGHTWLTPYLVWTPLPYDTPDDGTAFACVGAGDEGCLFIDLAAAPGMVVIRGDCAAATRLAESVASQLCIGPSNDRCIVITIGDALPQPIPSGTVWAASHQELSSLPPPSGTGDRTEIVFTRLTSDDDVSALADYMSAAHCRVIPVVLAELPGAPWSFTAQPARHLSELQPAVA